MKQIHISQGYAALVDDADFDFLTQWTWFAQDNKHTVYAARKQWIAGGKGKGTKIYMHRVLLSAPNETQIDHKDGNGLNNQRSNLRIVSQQDNLRNRARWIKGCESNYRGVYLDKRDGVWFSTITVNGKTFYLGRFIDEKTAHLAYLAKRAELIPEAFIRKDVL